MHNAAVASAASEIRGYLDDILALFKPGMKIQVVVWCPGMPERDLSLGTGPLDEAIAALERCKDRVPG